MMKMDRLSPRSGVTAVELLCSISIILILVSLLIGPVLKAYRKVKNFAGEIESPSIVDLVVDRLRAYHRTHASYPVLTVEFLRSEAILDEKTMQYIRDKKIVYIPFSSSDPETNQVIWFDISKDGYRAILKKDITSPPAPP